jgi:uncharacterized protein YajQ (UPF0234 family)
MIKKKPTKKYAKKKAVKKRAIKKISGVHKDTKSHNVKINVLSGINEQELRATAKKLFDLQTDIYLLKKQAMQTKNLKDRKPIQAIIRNLQKQYIALKKYYYTF